MTLWQHRETSESRLPGILLQSQGQPNSSQVQVLTLFIFVLSGWLVGLCLLCALDSGFDFLVYVFHDTIMEWIVVKKSSYWPHFNYYMISIFAPPSVSWGDSLRVVPKPHCSQSWGMPVIKTVLCLAQGTLLSALWWPKSEGNPKKRGYR